MSDYNPPDPLPPPLPIFNNLNWVISDVQTGGGGGAGTQGFQGLQGFGIGSTGAVGPQGVRGFQGWQGFQGNIGPFYTLFTETYGATTTFNIDVNGPLQKVVLTASATFAVTISNNRTFVLLVEQGGSGSYTVSWFSTILWSGGSPPVLTTTVGKTDTFGFIRTSAGQYLGYVIGLNA